MEKMRKDIMRDLSFMSYAPIIFISAATGEGIDELVGRLEELAAAGKKEYLFVFPSDKLGLVGSLYEKANVTSVEYDDDGARVVAVCDKKTAGQLSEYIQK